MITFLQGKLVEALPTRVTVNVNGVGYEVLTPLGTLGRCARDGDGRVTLQVHTHVREDAIVLFGFSDDRERMAFRVLTSVAGVGPKIAVGILGALPSSELVVAVARGDVKRLQSVPGVGKKIAERLALELKDKLASGVLAQSPGSAVPFVGPASSGPARAPMRPLVDALLRLGFKPIEAERAAADLRGREGEPLDVLVREALRVLTS